MFMSQKVCLGEWQGLRAQLFVPWVVICIFRSTICFFTEEREIHATFLREMCPVQTEITKTTHGSPKN